MADTEPTVAWTAMSYRCRVLGADGAEIGRAESLLGDEAADIFHGIAMRRASDHQTVEVPAARVKRITASAVSTDLAASDVASLAPYREQHWFHLGWGGLFQKHPEWDETSKP